MKLLNNNYYYYLMSYRILQEKKKSQVQYSATVTSVASTRLFLDIAGSHTGEGNPRR